MIRMKILKTASLFLLGVFAAALAEPPLSPSSNALTQRRSGISLVPHGSNGVHYAVERWYHDPYVDDRGVIYIQSDTPITLEHNERNRLISNHAGLKEHIIGINGEDGVPDSGDEGRIRYCVDKDWNFRFQWTDGFSGRVVAETNKHPLYTAPFSFSDLSYHDSTPVVGATGPSSHLDAYLAQPSEVRRAEQTFYWRGCDGPDGEEWHIITVGDDDRDVPGQDKYESWSSDGKIFRFVVNPQTPCLSFNPDTAAAQFYTTPAKGYFVPKIHSQTTYVSEDVSLTLKNITAPAEPMQWKMDSGDWQTYSGPIELDNLGLDEDTTCVLNFRIGARPVKTRTLHYRPSYPSDAEPHPSPVLFKDAATLERIRSTIATHPDFAARYSTLKRGLPTGGEPRVPTGIRFGYTDKDLFLPVLIEGPDAQPELAQSAKIQTLDNLLCLDPIGHEKSHNTSVPTRERLYHGYYLVAPILQVALSYDSLIADYRAPEYAGGYTAIEDYKVRDLLAASCMTAFQYEDQLSDFPKRTPHAPGFGMWDAAEHMASFIISIIMPTYDTPYYGTSGADGTIAVHTNTPFHNTAVSWFNLIDDPAWGESVYGLITTNEPTMWADRPSYFGRTQMGWIFASMMNARINFDGHRWPHLENAMALAENGTLPVGKQSASDPDTVTRDFSHSVLPLLMNEHFPERAQAAEGYLVSEASINQHNLDYYLSLRSPFGWFYIRPDWEEHVPKGGFMFIMK